MKTIYLPPELKNEILALKWPVQGFRRRISKMALQDALNFKTQSPLANALRAAALQRGGVIYDSSRKPADYVPDCYSTFDHAGRMWRCVFKGRVVLTWHGADKSATLAAPDGEERFTGVVTMADFMNVQYIAEQRANNND